jgi:hypothetical protein
MTHEFRTPMNNILYRYITGTLPPTPFFHSTYSPTTINSVPIIMDSASEDEVRSEGGTLECKYDKGWKISSCQTCLKLADIPMSVSAFICLSCYDTPPKEVSTAVMDEDGSFKDVQEETKPAQSEGSASERARFQRYHWGYPTEYEVVVPEYRSSDHEYREYAHAEGGSASHTDERTYYREGTEEGEIVASPLSDTESQPRGNKGKGRARDP